MITVVMNQPKSDEIQNDIELKIEKSQLHQTSRSYDS